MSYYPKSLESIQWPGDTIIGLDSNGYPSEEANNYYQGNEIIQNTISVQE
jgi:hypothetical protein